MDWIVAAITLTSMELLARKKWQGWIVGLINQPIWCYLMISKEMYPLAMIPLLLTWRYSVALMKWRREAA